MRTIHALAALLVAAGVLAAGVYYFNGGSAAAVANSLLANKPGAILAVEKGCTACHTLDGAAGIGPTWKGTYGTLRTLSDDSQVTADEAYIRRSIRDPAAEVVKGFDNIMIAPELSETELDQLLQLLKELGTANAE